jgi:CheY-like chemotaxis protein
MPHDGAISISAGGGSGLPLVLLDDGRGGLSLPRSVGGGDPTISGEIFAERPKMASRQRPQVAWDILILDADEDILTAMKEALRQEGFKVETGNPNRLKTDEILMLLRMVNPRLIIYDLGPFPAERLEEWRWLCCHPEAQKPYILTTTQRRKLELGSCPHPVAILPKPMNVEDLVAEVKRVLPPGSPREAKV